jgi:hypothetical protein
VKEKGFRVSKDAIYRELTRKYRYGLEKGRINNPNQTENTNHT